MNEVYYLHTGSKVFHKLMLSFLTGVARHASGLWLGVVRCAHSNMFLT